MVNDVSRRSHDFKDELGGKPEWVGVYCERALKLHPSWKGLSGKAKVKTGIGKSDLPGLQGGPRKRDLSAITWCARLGSIPTPGTGSFHPVAIETAAEATKLSELSMERVARRLGERAGHNVSER
jgi:hypothetical protein